MLVAHVHNHPSRHRPGRTLVPRALGRDPARDRAAALPRRALRVRAAERARRRAIAPVLPPEDPEGRGARERPAGRALGLLRVESRGARRDRGVRVRGKAGQTRRELRPRVLRLERDHQMKDEQIKQSVKQKYGQAALRVLGGDRGDCGDCGCASDPVSRNLYDAAETAALPEGAVRASLGCGNPTALAELHAGEVVLDLGSGGGIDVLLSAQRVGPTGRAYGLDMTDEMLALARENQHKAGVANVEFLKGEIERIPLPDASVDVIISNCVINLSADKDRVLAEAFRVLKPGGQLAVSDVVVRGEMPPAIRKSVELWIGCVAGALEEQEYREKLTKAGFGAIDLEPTRIYRVEDAREFLAGAGLDGDAIASEVDGKFMSAFVRAQKPTS